MSGAAIFAGISSAPNRRMKMPMASASAMASVAVAMPAARRGRSLYEVLSVSTTAKAGEIKAAYRTMAKRLHPDVAPEGAAEEFLELRRAYETLSDESARAQYDILISHRQAAFAGAVSLRSRRWETDQCW